MGDTWQSSLLLVLVLVGLGAYILAIVLGDMLLHSILIDGFGGGLLQVASRLLLDLVIFVKVKRALSPELGYHPNSGKGVDGLLVSETEGHATEILAGLLAQGLTIPVLVVEIRHCW
ncbi:hypothetical protein HG531_012949 [Fusarium graminearum]|nr:hypothetical protein HG531_012949 [Fusarium graminearum]